MIQVNESAPVCYLLGPAGTFRRVLSSRPLLAGPGPRRAPMEVNGEHRFGAPRSSVWKLLHDPVALERAIPGCERFEEVGPNSYDVTVRVPIAAIRGTYQGNVTLSDPRPGHAYRLLASGSGRPGRVTGEATIALRDDGPDTLISYTAELRAQGVIARLGSRLLGGAARMLAGRFFEALDEQLERQAACVAAAETRPTQGHIEQA